MKKEGRRGDGRILPTFVLTLALTLPFTLPLAQFLTPFLRTLPTTLQGIQREDLCTKCENVEQRAIYVYKTDLKLGILSSLLYGTSTVATLGFCST